MLKTFNSFLKTFLYDRLCYNYRRHAVNRMDFFKVSLCNFLNQFSNGAFIINQISDERYFVKKQQFIFSNFQDGDWINNTTYCNGKDSKCDSDLIVTIPKISLVSPGVVRHDYPFTEAPVVPQVFTFFDDSLKI